MLEEYFSIEIDENGRLQALPLVLPGFTPNLDYLPSFMLCIGFKVRKLRVCGKGFPLTKLNFQVDWWEEQQCFHDILEQLAHFYAPRAILTAILTASSAKAQESESHSDISDTAIIAMKDLDDQATIEEVEYAKHQLEHILFPAFRKYGNFPQDLMNRSMRKLTDLPQLYKVFERC